MAGSAKPRATAGLPAWPYLVAAGLGLWLVASPFLLGHFDPEAVQQLARDVTRERGLWAPERRNFWLGVNDVVTGLGLAAAAFLAARRRFVFAPWVVAGLGVWLLLAPLFLWAPTFAGYANDTAVGALVIAFAVVVTRTPGMDPAALADPADVPEGWTYTPSSLLQRLPIVVLATICLLFALPLTAYQLGHSDGVFEPFFSGEGELDGTETILRSEVSKAWPIPDAGMGVVAYVFEILLGLQGGRRRWRTSPWSVAMFGAVVVPLGVISIYFIIIQPIVIGTYCTFCLITAAAMLLMIPFALDEVVATGQFLVRSKRTGRPLIATFFRGGLLGDGRRSRGRPSGAPRLRWALKEMARGVTAPWNLVAAAAVGAAAMLSPLLIGRDAALADSLHLVGALAVTVSVIAMAEPARALRLLAVPLGLWLIAAPWSIPGTAAIATLSSIGCGALLVLLGLPRGQRSEERYGGWDRAVV